MVKGKSKAESGDEVPSGFYKHKYMNCYLTLNPDEIAEGKVSVRVHLSKVKAVEWGLLRVTDEGVQKLLEKHSWFGKSIFSISAEEVARLKSPKGKPDTYHRGVASALTRKAPR